MKGGLCARDLRRNEEPCAFNPGIFTFNPGTVSVAPLWDLAERVALDFLCRHPLSSLPH